jgi:hypothetical protein
MPVLSIRLMLDSTQAQADLDLLAQAAERSAELRQLLIDFGDLSAQLRCVQVEDAAAVSAGELRLRLECADGLAALLAAVRAGEFDRG